MNFVNTVIRRFKAACVELLKIDILRFQICRLRWMLYRTRLKVIDQQSQGVGTNTVSYNLGVFKTHAKLVFGMGKRMSLLLYPTAALLGSVPWANVLIVGPRTEDDILWAWSLGLRGARGLDLFSYSPWIDVGDIHATNYESDSFDAVLLGWMLAYSSRPDDAIREAKRILKPGGLLGIGMEAIADEKLESVKATLENLVNSSADLIKIVGEEVVFLYDPKPDGARYQTFHGYYLAVIFRLQA